MRIGAILQRWIEVLATLYLAWQDRQRELRSLMVRRENRHIVVRHAETGRDAMLRDPQAGTVLAAVPTGTGVSAELSRAAHNRFVVFELPADKVVLRQIAVPAQARKFLAGVIRNQIERLSPWPVNGVVYGFAVVEGDGAAATAALDVQILMAARADIEAARQDLAAHGLQIDRIVARGPAAADTAGPVTLWSRLADVSPEKLGSTARAIGIGIAASAAACLLLSSWAMLSTASLRSESEEIAARSKVLQRQAQAGRSASSLAAMPPAERAWLLKETSISSVILIEALSRALPEQAYVNEIRLEKDNLRITGLADDAPALLAPLERSEHMTDVRFFAPTARAPDGKNFRFSIEARVEPHISIGED